MKFWDSSAVVPLLYLEKRTPVLQRIYDEDTDVLVWALTRTEVLSALCRHYREGSLSKHSFSIAKQRLQLLQAAWIENRDYDQVRDRASRLLEVHALSAADALQLAAALVAVRERTHGFGFVTLDTRLAETAAKEGFSIQGLPA